MKTQKDLNGNIQNWYLETHPTDELASEINDTATFNELLNKLKSGEDIYAFLGVSDSLVRERLFEGLATLIGEDYKYVYNLWLNN